MNRKLLAMLLPIVLLLSGCLGQMKLDELTLLLTLGVDLTQDGKLDIYSASPVFNREAKKKTEILHVHAATLREGRDKFAAESNGTVATGKIQNVVLTKKLLQTKSILDLLDVIFRDPKSALKAELLMFNGPVKELMEMDFKDKPRLSVFLRELVRSAHTSEASVMTSVRYLYQQFHEKGITPFLPEAKMINNRLLITGTALLNKEGYYLGSLDQRETPYLLILQQDTKHPIHLTVTMADSSLLQKDNANKNISFSIDYSNYDYDTSYRDGHFQFDLHMKFRIVLTELLVEGSPTKEHAQLEQAIAKVMQKEMESLVAKLQKYQVDPLGMGLYARAYTYKQWKEVQHDWEKAFSRAKVNILPEIEIISVGSLRDSDRMKTKK